MRLRLIYSNKMAEMNDKEIESFLAKVDQVGKLLETI